jgi:hypothetical protein
MRGLTNIVLTGVLALAAPAMAQEVVVGGERAAAPPSAAPRPLVSQEDQARERANGEWAQNILDGKPNLSDEEKAAAAETACLPAGTKPFGEVRMSVGTGGYKSTGFTMVQPTSGCGEIAVSADWTNGGNGFRRRR